MKKNGLLNYELNNLISKMGHKDMMTICDAGFPIPDDSNRIDFALKRGVPKFIEILESILEELVIEQVILADEIKVENDRLHKEILTTLGDDIPISYYSHEKFKELSRKSKGIVRSGEVVPYANIILVSGVNF